MIDKYPEVRFMSTQRKALPVGTILCLDTGSIYKITGEPVGHGGGSLIYPCLKLIEKNGIFAESSLHYALKECYPLSDRFDFIRSQSGEIKASEPNEEADRFLAHARTHLLEEAEISQLIYHSSTRMVPTREQSASMIPIFPKITEGKSEQEVFEHIQTCQKTVMPVPSAVTVMDSLSNKGRSISDLLREYGSLSALQTFHLARQILYALREIHEAGFLHLDIQDGNIFVKGALEDESDYVSILDFGSARPFSDGNTNEIEDRMIFSTDGFTAPEILTRNDGSLRLTPAADLYSIGCLMLLLLTGSRRSSSEITANRSGNYISRFALKKTGCPKYLQERMQRIAARALADDPSDRYQNTNEMLQDVTAFEEALRPHINGLDAVDYDAFICYKHGPIDSHAALELQKKLEQFKIPKELRAKSGRSAFQKIFVDEGEISSGADFGAQIEAALKNAGWLIVLCSSETPSSRWVHSEIKTFLKYHDRSRILAVLTEGEPASSFPEELLRTSSASGSDSASLKSAPSAEAGFRDSSDAGEVLAADARGTSLHEVLKKLHGDALLKLAAPMLGTTFDALKQRRRSYVMKRAFTAASVITVLSVLFAAYSIRQNLRIQEAARANLLVQERLLAQEAEQKLKNHDNAGAVQTALNALTLGGNELDTPAVPEAENVLTKALGLYTTPDTADQYTATDSFELEHDVENFFIDRGNQLLIARDASTVYFWDLNENILKNTVSIAPGLASYDWFFSAEMIDSSHHRFVFAANKRVYCYDTEHHEILWEAASENPETQFSLMVEDLQYVESLNAILCLTKNNILRFSVNDGSLMHSYEFSFSFNSRIYDENNALSRDDSCYVFSGYEYDSESSESHDYLYLFSLVSEELRKIPIGDRRIRHMVFTEDNKLLAAATVSGGDLEEAGIQIPDYDCARLATWFLINPSDYENEKTDTLNPKWEITLPYYRLAVDIPISCNVFSDHPETAAIWVDNQYAMISLEDGSYLLYNETNSPIVTAIFGTADSGDPLLVIHDQSGSVYSSWPESVVIYSWFPNGIKHLDYESGRIYLSFESGSRNCIVRYQGHQYDSEYTTLGTLGADSGLYSYFAGSIPWSVAAWESRLTFLANTDDEDAQTVTADLSGLASYIPSSAMKERTGGLYMGDGNPKLVMFLETASTESALFLIDTVTGEITSTPADDGSSDQPQYQYYLGISDTSAYYLRYDLDVSRDLKLYRLSAGEEQAEMLAVITPNGDGPFSISGTIDSDDYGALVIGYLADGKITSFDFYEVNGTQSKAEQIISGFQESPEIFSYTTDDSGIQYYSIYTYQVLSVYNRRNSLLCSIETADYIDFTENYLNMGLTPDQKSLLVLYQTADRTAELVQYSLQNGSVEHSAVFSFDCENDEWYFTEDNSLVLTGDNSAAEISLDSETWGVRAVFGDEYDFSTVSYDEESDRYYVISGTDKNCAYIPRYSTEDLIEKANAFTAN